MSISNTLAIILAVSEENGLQPLTDHRTRSAVPFGGSYRIIDFALTNCLRSGLRRVLVLSQFKSLPLYKHLRDAWSIFNPELGEYITHVPPQMLDGRNGYAGSADAIYQNLYLLRRNTDEHVFVLSGAHIYRMDYAAMLEQHVQTKADATLACIPMEHPGADPRLQGLHCDKQGCIEAFEPAGDKPATVSMELAVLRKSVLIQALEEDAANGESGHDLGHDVLPALLAGHKLMAYEFGRATGRVTPDRYWRKLTSLDVYYEANMDLLRSDPPLDLYQADWPVRSRPTQKPPARTVPGRSCNEGVCVNSMIAGGVVIAGGGVNHSILFSGVHVDDAAIVEEAILLNGVQVGEGSQLRRCIVDKHVHIPPGEQIGFDPEADAHRFTLTEKGIVVVPASYCF